MIFANISIKNTEVTENLVIVDDKRRFVTKVDDICSYMHLEYPKNMISLIELFDQTILTSMKDVLQKNKFHKIPFADITFLSPIPYPRRNVFCLGKNYVEHANEIPSIPGGGNQLPQNPIYFSKVAYPCMGPEDTLLNHKEITQDMDYEAELAIIIGKKGKDIPLEDVKDYIFGYTIGNDISIRNIQFKHIQWFKGKSLDTCCSMGPYIVMKDEVSFPPSLNISCKVNGEIRQHSNTSKLIFDIPMIIHDLSQGMSLFPGDIIFTGTPSGVGYGFKPPKTLNPGDVVECEIEKLGFLRNYIED